MSNVKKLARKVIPKSAIKKAEHQYRLTKAKTAYALYGMAPKGTKVIAVTGTNGKTTTCAIINAILKEAGYKTAVYTTAFTEIAGKYEPNHSHMTVTSVWSVQKFFKQAKEAGVQYVILEVTSHALDQYRIYGVPVEVAVITNLTQDHLDYHKTMQNYAAAKAKLLTEYHPKSIILNADDDWFDYFSQKADKSPISVGKKQASCQIKAIQYSPQGTGFSLLEDTVEHSYNMQLVGEFNVYNASMAIAACRALSLSYADIAKGLNALKGVAGRLEPVLAGQPFMVLVDYAHTPDAVKNVLQAARGVASGMVRLVFGATGVGEYARDTTKRGPMGEVAVKYADYVYVTDDETYLEDPAQIRKAVVQGGLAAGGAKKYVEIADRKDAIKQAFIDAKPGDVVILAGIGHQNYRSMAGKKEPWDERQIAKNLLAVTK
ncbi:MAG: UDP-N-acetylmuramoyl-L-alanyl-D-glutamate--2,6-diaminopimelate ligase [Patescibacteria group bacterium]|nr:UDP-N-acetylmuramoyl-L-alanyl-D-glutamate--2,6-diaminopimelate ligase [Patescibacteria group bacterium]